MSALFLAQEAIPRTQNRTAGLNVGEIQQLHGQRLGSLGKYISILSSVLLIADQPWLQIPGLKLARDSHASTLDFARKCSVYPALPLGSGLSSSSTHMALAMFLAVPMDPA